MANFPRFEKLPKGSCGSGSWKTKESENGWDCAKLNGTTIRFEVRCEKGLVVITRTQCKYTHRKKEERPSWCFMTSVRTMAKLHTGRRCDKKPKMSQRDMRVEWEKAEEKLKKQRKKQAKKLRG